MLLVTVSFPFTVNTNELNGTNAPKVIELQDTTSVEATVGGFVNDKVTPMVTSSANAGTPAGDQLPPVFQLDTAPAVPPAHTLVAAPAKVVCKISNNTTQPCNFFIKQTLSGLFLLVVKTINEYTAYYVRFLITIWCYCIMNKVNKKYY